MGTISNKLIIIISSILFEILISTHFWPPTICFAHNVPAMFVFGDSVVEAGNNFYLNTIATPVYPNGIDFPKGSPSGRYTNSRMITDIIGEELGFKEYTPPFLAPNTTGDRILKGVNYASAGAGILPASGAIFGERIWMDKQVAYFAKTRQDIISRIGSSEAQSLLRKSIYVIVIGANDMIFEELYLTSDANRYVDEVLSNFKSQLTRLYNLDARKIAVSNAPKAGSIPFERDLHLCADDCASAVNILSKYYNSRLKSMLEDLTNNLEGSTFVYVDYYAATEDLTTNYREYGFETAGNACCALIGRHGGYIPCFSASRVCTDRTKYVFWDPFHPTESALLIAAKNVLDGGLKYVSPINIRQLANS